MVSGRSDKNTGRVRLGMVGGGQGAFIGAVHRLAARMDDHYEFVAGALSSDAKRAKASGEELGLSSDRIYSDFREMAKAEASRPDGIEAVAVVTPNHMHVPVCKAFLEAGIHVICDKPLAFSLKEAKQLETLVKKKNKLVFALTSQLIPAIHDPPGARYDCQWRAGPDPLRAGRICPGLARDSAREIGPEAGFVAHRPEAVGCGGAVGDIGTHAMQLASFVSGLTLDELSADLTSFVKGRKLDDNVSVLLRFKGGAKGMLWASQIAVGNENALTLRVFGEKGGFEWEQEKPEPALVH